MMNNLLTSKVFYKYFKKYCESKNINPPKYKLIKEVMKMNRVSIDKNVIEENPKILDNYDEYLKIIRTVVQFLLENMFDIMLIERDSNTFDTPKRVAKLFVPDKKTDDELMSGRWCIKPNLTTFENGCLDCDSDSIIEVESSVPLVKVSINLYSLCSHHLLPFGTINSEPSVHIVYAIDKIYPGLSKIGRYVNYISRRGWLQESLTKTIADGLYEEFKLKGVLVSLNNIVHTCSIHRGYSDDMEMETVYCNGIFKKDKKLLEQATLMINKK